MIVRVCVGAVYLWNASLWFHTRAFLFLQLLVKEDDGRSRRPQQTGEPVVAEEAAKRSDPDDKVSRTLFATSVPSPLTAQSLRSFFEDCFGEVDEVYEKTVVQKTPSSGGRGNRVGGVVLRTSFDRATMFLSVGCEGSRSWQFVCCGAAAICHGGEVEEDSGSSLPTPRTRRETNRLCHALASLADCGRVVLLFSGSTARAPSRASLRWHAGHGSCR